MLFLCGPRSCRQPVLGAEGSGQARLRPGSTVPRPRLPDTPDPVSQQDPHFLPLCVPPPPRALGTVYTGPQFPPRPGSTGCLEPPETSTSPSACWVHPAPDAHAHTGTPTRSHARAPRLTHTHALTPSQAGLVRALLAPAIHTRALSAGTTRGGSSPFQINWEKLTWADISEPSAHSPKSL